MKLEAVNGNLLSLTVKTEQLQQQQQQQQHHHQIQQQLLKVEPSEDMMLVDDEGGDKDTEEEHQNAELMDDKEMNGGGKKKGVRKKRSLNWEEAERSLLLEIIKPKVEYVENRSVEAKNIKSKRLAWMQITKQFNMLNFRHRSLEQIQVQWRSMKNAAKRDYQQKRDKTETHETLEGMDMIEFMEEMQKEPPTNGRGRGAIKKELHDSDEEDTPLAALPTSTNTSDDTLQSSTLALPSPPVSAAESQSESQNTPTRSRKKPGPQPGTNSSALKQQTAGGEVVNGKMRKQRNQSLNADTMLATTNDINLLNAQHPTISSPTSSPPFNTSNLVHTLAADDKYRKQLFDLVKRARLAEMDYARREHEQRLRHQELKWNYCRQQEELKLRHLREEHETRMRQYQEEHEARILTFSLPVKRMLPKSGGKAPNQLLGNPNSNSK